jgi:hypothetical protein
MTQVNQILMNQIKQIKMGCMALFLTHTQKTPLCNFVAAPIVKYAKLNARITDMISCDVESEF